jgi:hypothetical protein
MTQRNQEDLATLATSAACFLLVAAVFLFAVVLATRSMWNMVVPEVFGLPPLTLTNAIGLVGLGVVLRFVPVLSKE